MFHGAKCALDVLRSFHPQYSKYILYDSLVMSEYEVFFVILTFTYILSKDLPLYQPYCMQYRGKKKNIKYRRSTVHDDVIKWKHFPRNWPFVRGISPVNSPHKGQWRGALMFSLICVWINGWVNNREAGDLSRYRAHDDVTVMVTFILGNNRNQPNWDV